MRALIQNVFLSAPVFGDYSAAILGLPSIDAQYIMFRHNSVYLPGSKAGHIDYRMRIPYRSPFEKVSVIDCSHLR